MLCFGQRGGAKKLLQLLYTHVPTKNDVTSGSKKAKTACSAKLQDGSLVSFGFFDIFLRRHWDSKAPFGPDVTSFSSEHWYT